MLFRSFVDAGFVRRTGTGPVPVQLGTDGFLDGWPVAVFAFGLILVVALYVKRVRGAILIAIVVTTVVAIVVEALAEVGPQVVGDKVNPLGWNLNVPKLPSSVVDTPSFGTVGEFNLLGSFGQVGAISAILLIFTLMLADFFDTMGTMTAIGADRKSVV